MLKHFLILILSFVFMLNISHAEEICPETKKNPPSSGAEELKMHEVEFSYQHAMESTKYLEKDVIEIIKNYNGSGTILDQEGFYIGYPNSITFIKGTLLRQETLIAKRDLEIANLKMQMGKASKAEVKDAEIRYSNIKKKLCGFLRNAEYVD